MTPPTRYALVPVEPSEEIIAKAIRDSQGQIVAEDVTSAWSAMIATSPNGGCVTAEMLERAARILHGSDRPNQACRGKAKRIAEEAFGLRVTDAPAGEVVDG